MSRRAVESTTVLLPQLELRSAYDATVEHMFEQVVRNLDKPHTLSNQRWTPLPKLVSEGLEGEPCFLVFMRLETLGIGLSI